MASLVILVTGANRGLGLGIMELLCQRAPSATLLLASRDASAGAAARASLLSAHPSATIEVMQLDVTSDAAIEAAAASIQAQHGRLDVLINNAGILRPPGWEAMSLRAMYTETLAVNLTSAAVLTHALLPLLRAAPNPCVVGVTSGLASLTNALAGRVPHAPTYGASKAGLNGALMHMFGQERARARTEGGGAPRFYVVQPGVVRTAFTGHTRGKDPEDGAEAIVRLALDGSGLYEPGTYWEFEDGQMRQVPW